MRKLTLVLLVLIIAVLLSPTNASADGGFVVPKFVWDKHKDINEPMQKAILVYDAGREDLILQVKYEGPVEEFGWLIPVPNLPTVQQGSMKCFYELSRYTQEHFEPRRPRGRTNGGTLSAAGMAEPEPVKVIEVKTVGAYEVAVLSTKDAGALEKWLAANNFYFPTNKTDVIDGYVKQEWYFIAARINLGKGDSFHLAAESPKGKALPDSAFATRVKLASGELHPLQISFASDRCVFPLKISSINGQPSEVQVYVLSPEPLLEKTMFEKKLPKIDRNDLAAMRAHQSEQYERMQLQQRNLQIRMLGGTKTSAPPPPVEDRMMVQKMVEKLQAIYVAYSDQSLPYAKVTRTDLPDCSKWIPRLADKSWWLTKQTWTFRPEEMRDLVFEPAISILSDEFGTEYGDGAADKLARFGADAVPAFLAAFQSTNPAVRITATSIFNRHYGSIQDPRLTEAAVAWLKDAQPEVRMAGVNVLTGYGSWNPKNADALVATLRDEDAGVRRAAMFGLPRFGNDLGKFIPAFEVMLKDKDPGVQLSGLLMLQRLHVEIPREDLLPFFKSSDPEALSRAYSQLHDQNEQVSDDEVLPLLQNSQPTGRLLGLRVLDQNAEKQSVELALPLLKDSDELVQVKAAQTLRALTGQHIPSDQPDQWVKWWTANKTNFVVQLHPEELRPQFPAPTGGGGDRPSPFPRP